MRVCYVSLEDPEEANLLEDYKIGQTAYGLNKYLGMQGPVVGFNTVTKELIVHFEDHGFSAPTCTSLNREQVSKTAPLPADDSGSKLFERDDEKAEPIPKKTHAAAADSGGASRSGEEAPGSAFKEFKELYDFTESDVKTEGLPDMSKACLLADLVHRYNKVCKIPESIKDVVQSRMKYYNEELARLQAQATEI